MDGIGSNEERPRATESDAAGKGTGKWTKQEEEMVRVVLNPS